MPQRTREPPSAPQKRSFGYPHSGILSFPSDGRRESPPVVQSRPYPAARGATDRRGADRQSADVPHIHLALSFPKQVTCRAKSAASQAVAGRRVPGFCTYVQLLHRLRQSGVTRSSAGYRERLTWASSRNGPTPRQRLYREGHQCGKPEVQDHNYAGSFEPEGDRDSLSLDRRKRRAGVVRPHPGLNGRRGRRRCALPVSTGSFTIGVSGYRRTSRRCGPRVRRMDGFPGCRGDAF